MSRQCENSRTVCAVEGWLRSEAQGHKSRLLWSSALCRENDGAVAWGCGRSFRGRVRLIDSKRVLCPCAQRSGEPGTVQTVRLECWQASPGRCEWSGRQEGNVERKRGLLKTRQHFFEKFFARRCGQIRLGAPWCANLPVAIFGAEKIFKNGC